MQIWLEVESGDFRLRAIGPNLSVRKFVGAQRALLHFDADRFWWDERLHRGNGRYVDVGVFSIPRHVLIDLLHKLDERTPALVTQASKMAAQTQAVMEEEAKERGERLAIAE